MNCLEPAVVRFSGIRPLSGGWWCIVTCLILCIVTCLIMCIVTCLTHSCPLTPAIFFSTAPLSREQELRRATGSG